MCDTKAARSHASRLRSRKNEAPRLPGAPRLLSHAHARRDDYSPTTLRRDGRPLGRRTAGHRPPAIRSSRRRIRCRSRPSPRSPRGPHPAGPRSRSGGVHRMMSMACRRVRGRGASLMLEQVLIRQFMPQFGI